MKAYITNNNEPSKDRIAFEMHKQQYYVRLFHAVRRAILKECDNMGAELFDTVMILDDQTITEVCGAVAALFSAETPVNVGDNSINAAAFRVRASRYIGATMEHALQKMAEKERAEAGSIVKIMNLKFSAADRSPIERAKPGEKAPE